MNIGAVRDFYSEDLPYDLYIEKKYDTLWKIFQVFPEIFMITLQRHKAIENKIEIAGMYVLLDLYTKNIKSSNIINALKKSKFFGYDETDGTYFNYDKISNLLNDDIINILKVLTDDKVIERCNEERIIEFIKEPSMNVLKDIIYQTYGEKATVILNSRPLLELKDIPNLKIFDEKIINYFGESEVHNALSYSSNIPVALAYFANNTQEIANFEKFGILVNGFFGDNVAGENQKINAFFRFQNIISEIELEEMTFSRVEALKLAICDMDFLDTKMIPLENLNDLDNYIKARDDLFNEAMKKTSNISIAKEILSRKLFGLKYNENIKRFSPDNLSLYGLFEKYNIESFLEDSRTYESGLLAKDELEYLETVKRITKVKDITELKNMYYMLNNKRNYLNPILFKETIKKIPLQYTKELVSQLFNCENLDKEKCTEENGITTETNEEGIPIIQLKGMDFKMLVHAMTDRSGLQIPKHFSEKEIWNNLENGCSTVSTCLICSGMLDNAQSDESMPLLGFSSVGAENIIGMSHMDAGVDNETKVISPDSSYYQFSMTYPEELIRKTAAQILGIEDKDIRHPYNEVFFYRKEQNKDKVSTNNSGGRIMPDYIVSIGKHNQKHIQLAKAFGRNGKPLPIVEIHKEYYPDRKHELARERDLKHKIKDKADTERV